MNAFNLAAAFILAYLLGSIPSAVWIGKIFHNMDVRQHGSGNAGATNVIRVLGWKTGIPVLIIDLAKGFTAASLPVLLHVAPHGSAHLDQSSDPDRPYRHSRTYISRLCGLQGRKGSCHSLWSPAGHSAPSHCLLHRSFPPGICLLRGLYQSPP